MPSNESDRCAGCGHERKDHQGSSGICCAVVERHGVNPGLTISGLCDCNGFVEKEVS